MKWTEITLADGMLGGGNNFPKERDESFERSNSNGAGNPRRNSRGVR